MEAAAGYQWVRGQLRLGVELTLDIFNRLDWVDDVSSASSLSCLQVQCPTGRSFPMVGFALTLGFAQ